MRWESNVSSIPSNAGLRTAGSLTAAAMEEKRNGGAGSFTPLPVQACAFFFFFIILLFFLLLMTLVTK